LPGVILLRVSESLLLDVRHFLSELQSLLLASGALQ
jgi:hypothetical protein